ncbi:HU family DNA-binding protein [Parenemella sanctibonifatiensis]|uniref:DNA-binding protein HU n=1 Tax=Parenemella sanctibonifatiensis TaxID=2016505 RepID=A0A255EER6_9ACTN|nr:HU family DNA-binding protein [Parenemella sanctibonifatiensis]OYN90044.1 DNA-binding protein HU [Parenemella sanctibonifatiensis]OYN91271.1 DNA-binding protein HU [Parenemella sanctibonifatiensis]
MNKAELITALAEHYDGNKAEAGRALDAVVQTITAAVVDGEKVTITGFGSFSKGHRGPRTVRNPRTGEQSQSKAVDYPKFSAGSLLKAYVSGEKKLPTK